MPVSPVEKWLGRIMMVLVALVAIVIIVPLSIWAFVYGCLWGVWFGHPFNVCEWIH